MISKKKRNRGEREIGLGRLRERERALWSTKSITKREICGGLRASPHLLALSSCMCTEMVACVWMNWHEKDMCILWYIEYKMLGLMY
jgi:hypothetical protein